MHFDDLNRLASPSAGLDAFAPVSMGRDVMSGSRWTRLGGSDYEVRVSDTTMVEWAIIEMADHLFLGAAAYGRTVEVVLVITESVKRKAAERRGHVGRTQRYQGVGLPTLDLLVRYNPVGDPTDLLPCGIPVCRCDGACECPEGDCHCA